MTAALATALSADEQRRIAKLPEWAYSLVQRLVSTVEHWREQALAAATSTGTNTRLVVYDSPSFERGLPPDSTVRFYLSGDCIEVGYVINGDTRTLQANSGSGQLVIHPRAANGIRISVLK